MNMQDMKIATRLKLGFGALAVLIGALGGIAALRIADVQTEFDAVMKDRYPKIVTLVDVKGNVDLMARAIRNVFIMTNPADVQAQFDEIDKANADNNEKLDQLKQVILSDKGKALLAKVDEARGPYREARTRLVSLFKAGKVDEARTALLQDLRPKQLDFMKQLDALVDFQNELMVASGKEVEATVSQARAVIIGFVAFAFAFAGVVALWIIRSTTRPLNEAVAVARRVADGDLSIHVEASGRNETAQLLAALSGMQTRLAAIVGDVRGNAEGVASASAQIAQGNNDLSGRTEEQASALEQTAASMEELGSTVKQNADNAQQGNQLAQRASGVAREGGEVVGQVVETMKGINEASRKIADIISVIDGIAFQTNILALNAAVEAARAGEQGRGFAVVAGEVRTLAQRSAEAAKEIKGLITASVERVEQGSALVDRAGATMQEVVQSIQRVTDIMGEISAASTEQSAGVAQIGEAVQQMDQTTQQNAALVEESAAAAESLKGQAQQLVSAVAVFKLAHDAQVAPVAVAVAKPAATPKTYAGAERRGPHRAKNVVRPGFAKNKPAAPAAKAEPVAVAKTGTDDGQWTSF